jgi:hypothetical protein
VDRPPADDVLADWIAARERHRRIAVDVWLSALAVAGLLVLMSDRFLAVPALPAVGAAVWLLWAWSGDVLYCVRSGVASHPVVRAELPWSVASGHTLPLGWYEAPVRGAVHRTPRGWVWRPSPLIAAELPVLGWSDDEVTLQTISRMWGPFQPPTAQLRLYLRGGGTVEFVVWHPDRLLPASPVGSSVTS